MQNSTLKQRNLAIFLLLLATLSFFISLGINAVSIPLVIYLKSVPTSLMGVSSAVEIAAGILIAKFLSSLSHKIGTLKLIIGFTISNAAAILIISFYQNFAIWLLLISISPAQTISPV